MFALVNNKRSLGRSVLASLIVLALCGVPQAIAADFNDIGMVDQTALANIPMFQGANRQFGDFRSQLQRQFAGRAKTARSAADQQKLAAEFQSKLATRQRELFAPLFQSAQVAIASIASSKNLSVVLDRRIVIMGGQDITKNVVDLLNSPGSPVPPVNTPPPSSVGYVDQAQIDQLEQFKKAQLDFQKYTEEQSRAAQDKLKTAKGDQDRNKVMVDYRKTLDDKQNQLVKPLVDKTRDAIADVAKSQKLLLVVDRANLIFGGKDVTEDVKKKLK